MPISAPPVFVRHDQPEGYGTGQPLPITGATPLTGVSAQQINDSPDLFNQWLRSQPWYTTALKAWGVNPNDVHLSPQQRAQVRDAAQRAGVDTSGGNGAFGIDTQGNFEDTSMPTWTKVALAGFGAAAGGTALAGVLGGGGAGAGAATGVDYGAAATVPEIGANAGALATVPAIGGGAATTAATTAAGVGTAAKAGSWLTSPYASLIGQGINAIGGIVGANISAGAQEKGLAQQQAQFDAALAAQKEQQDYDRGTAAELKDYNRNQYGSYLGRLQPYADTGYEANDRLGQFMNSPRSSGGTRVAPQSQNAYALPPQAPAPSPMPSPAPAPAPATPSPTPAPAPQPQAQQPATVRMRAPNGQEKDVPADQVAHYQQLGATVLGDTRRIHTMDYA